MLLSDRVPLLAFVVASMSSSVLLLLITGLLLLSCALGLLVLELYCYIKILRVSTLRVFLAHDYYYAIVAVHVVLLHYACLCCYTIILARYHTNTYT